MKKIAGERVFSKVPILERHRVNALNVSIRHAMPDLHTALAWAPVETFAFVLYHKQRTREKNQIHAIDVTVYGDVPRSM